MGRKANTIYQDLATLANEVYERLTERARQEYKNIEDYSIEEILGESKIFKDMFHESGTIVSDLFLANQEDLFDSEIEEWKAVHKEYKDLCKFINKWSSKQNEIAKQVNNNQ